ncbi:MAG: phosphate acyltransferase PlsX [Planctomycetes bacterium]|nr:phosphate acyltransferase PlsX [Planctomycetota bacterium]
MRIAIDGMGGDHAPDEVVSGVIEAAGQHPDAKLLIVGQKDRVNRPGLPANVEVVHAPEVIAMDEEPVKAIIRKRNSSLGIAYKLIKNNEVDAVISAGNTGAVVAGAIMPMLGLGKLEGVKRPGIAIPMPMDTGFCAMIDAGANPNAKAVHLVQYAVMGACYSKYLNPGLKLPRVGILNIGEEVKKGTELQRETHAILEKAHLNFEFVGNIEPMALYHGEADVVVSDGFSGNLALKMAEGLKEYLLRQFHAAGVDETAEVKARILSATAKMDHSEHGGAPVLGVRGIVIKCHGRATARTITNAIRVTAAFIKGKLNDHIVDELRKLSVRSAWFSKWFSAKEEE